MYRAVIESTAFGTCKIIKQLEEGGCPIEELYGCGGLASKNPLVMQIWADVCGREIKVSASDQTVALGSAMWGAVAAGAANGGYDDIKEAAKKMARLRDETYKPNAENHAMYQKLFAEYERIHDWFGREAGSVMKKLKDIKVAVHGA